MRNKLMTGAIAALALDVTAAAAQSIAQLGGPANPPSASFTGQQFVDSRGCVFLRAGFGNRVNWVPRVDRNRKPLCGFPPTGGTQVAAAIQADMAPDPAATSPQPSGLPPARSQPVAQPSAAPAPTVIATPRSGAPLAATFMLATALPTTARPSPAPDPTVISRNSPATPAVVAAPRRGFFLGAIFGEAFASEGGAGAVIPPAARPVSPGPAYQTAAAPGIPQVACPLAAPQLDRVQLRGGGTALVCTLGNGTLDGWLPPSFPQGSNFGAALNPLFSRNAMTGAVILSSGELTLTAASPLPIAARVLPKPPKGYKIAWKDDRLNPMRALGTAQGQAQQDLIWTRTVPAFQVGAGVQPGFLVRRPRLQTTVSTMSAPETAPRPGDAGLRVQIGTFGQPGNAQGAAARLAALGLPVAMGHLTRGGHALQVVYAGPFGSAEAAGAALSAVQAAGFSDAFVN